MRATAGVRGIRGVLGLLALLLALPSPAAASPSDDVAQERAATGLTVDAPKIALSGVPFEVAVSADSAAAGSSYTLRSADGRDLASGTAVAGVTDTLNAGELDGSAFPLSLEVEGGAGAFSMDPLHLPGWISLLPPLVAILLALIFREVVISLFFGVWLGALFFAGLDPLAATWRTIDQFAMPALASPDHASIIIFSLLLGGMVGVMGRSGGTRGIVDAVSPLATSPRRAQAATFLSGLSIFFDDYANTLIVGNTMRPITDRLKVSREKLAYLVDSTAAPVAAIIFVSTWVGFEISLIGDGLRIAANQAGTSASLAQDLMGANPFTVFIHSIPYLFYPILALIMVALVIWTQRDFGPMWEAENRASRGDGLYREGAQLMADTSGGEMEPKEGVPHRWYNAVIPVLTVIFVVLGGLYFGGRAAAGAGASLWDVFGAADPFAALLWGSLSGCIVAIALSVGQRILTAEEAIDAWLGGLRAMVLAAVILVLAWSLSAVTQELGTATYLAHILSEALPPQLVPVLTFVTAALIAFATGTSWGTMAILIPIVIPLVVALGGGVDFAGGTHYTVLLGSISSVLAGAIFGDHCSPISDTTVMSSMASACDHVDHVRTQLPYAVTVALVGMLLGDIATAYGLHPAISYAVGAAVLYGVLRFVGRPDHDSPQWEDGSVGEEEGRPAAAASPGD